MGDDESQNLAEKLSQTKISLTNSLTDVNEDLINEKNNEIGRVTKWAIGFEKLLNDPLGLQIFTVINQMSMSLVEPCNPQPFLCV